MNASEFILPITCIGLIALCQIHHWRHKREIKCLKFISELKDFQIEAHRKNASFWFQEAMEWKMKSLTPSEKQPLKSQEDTVHTSPSQGGQKSEPSNGNEPEAASTALELIKYASKHLRHLDMDGDVITRVYVDEKTLDTIYETSFGRVRVNGLYDLEFRTLIGLHGHPRFKVQPL